MQTRLTCASTHTDAARALAYPTYYSSQVAHEDHICRCAHSALQWNACAHPYVYPLGPSLFCILDPCPPSPQGQCALLPCAAKNLKLPRLGRRGAPESGRLGLVAQAAHDGGQPSFTQITTGSDLRDLHDLVGDPRQDPVSASEKVLQNEVKFRRQWNRNFVNEIYFGSDPFCLL